MKKVNKKNSRQNWTWLIVLAVIAVAGIAVALIVGFGGNDEAAPSAGTHYVQIDIADYGTITAELDGDTAPITVANFVELVKSGFYDGLTFHRIISGFMIQGGDPNGNGTGGSANKIKGEFSSNGVKNDIAHERGVLSMARSSAPDSASSQFFIMHDSAPHLNGQYAAFGRVLSGMEVVDAICERVPVTDYNGTVARENQPVITSIKLIDKPAQ
ncbi:MAG: peptidylprolyl isomerase [Clostridia bacterium]|nr:peptidylprolyl isomerase [Clostridia bacterium]